MLIRLPTPCTPLRSDEQKLYFFAAPPLYLPTDGALVHNAASAIRSITKMLANKNNFEISLSFIMAIGCALMLAVGLWSYFGIYDHFKKYPGELTRSVYNKFYFVPYFMLMFGCLCHSFAGISHSIRLWLSSIMLGMSIFCFFFSNVGGIGHDFGHVLFGGCFESMQYDLLILGFNIVMVLYSLLLTYINFARFHAWKLADQTLNRTE